MREVWPLVPLAADHRWVSRSSPTTAGCSSALSLIATSTMSTCSPTVSGMRWRSSPRWRWRRDPATAGAGGVSAPARDRAAARHRPARRRRRPGPDGGRAFRGARPGGGRPDRLGDGRGRPARSGRARRAGDGGDRLRRVRGQGRQELRRHRVPLRLPQGQARRSGVIDEDPRARRSSTSPSRSASCSRCCRSPTRPRRRCSRRSSPPRRATRSSSARRRGRRAAPTRAIELLQEAGEARRAPARRAAGRPRPDARRLAVPVPPPRHRLHLDDRRPEGGRRRPTRPASRASASAPATRRSTCTAAPTCAMAVVDILISKTFDASVICPAEQTLRRRRRDRRRA